MVEFSICTYNVHHFYTENGKFSYDLIVELLSEIKPDIICLQVSHITYDYQSNSNKKISINQPFIIDIKISRSALHMTSQN